MASVEVDFQTNDARGCSELLLGEFRVVASVMTELQAIDFEIELRHEGTWATLYFERTVIKESLSHSGTRRLVRRTLADVALKKIQGYRLRLAQGELLHPMQRGDSASGWLAQIESEPL